MKKVLVVFKRSAFELYTRSSDQGVRGFMDRGGPEVERMERSHHIQENARERVLETLSHQDFEVTSLSRGAFRKVGDAELVITVGGDGTFLHAAQVVRRLPMLGINTDPDASVGFFCTATAFNFQWAIENLDKLPRTTLHRLEVAIDEQPVDALALNDVFYGHVSPAAVTRCRAKINGKNRYVKSSGLLVATAAGSTGWMYQEGGDVIPIEDRRIQCVFRGVRGERARFASQVELHSLTREAHIYLDGIPMVTDIALGSRIVVRGGAPLTVIGDLDGKRQLLET